VLIHRVLFTINPNKLPHFLLNHSADRNTTCCSTVRWRVAS